MNFNVKIIRAKRKSICVSVSSENEITVRCPLRSSEKAINDFIESKKEWIKRVVAKNSAKLSENASVLEFKEIFINGKKLPLVISDRNIITENTVYVKSIKHIKNLFISSLSESFLAFVQCVSERINLYAADFGIKSYKSRWGCCDRKGVITFNYLLFMLPSELQEYVIVHELCHTVYFNHSPKFWKLVGEFVDYKNLRKRLKDFDFVIKLETLYKN